MKSFKNYFFACSGVLILVVSPLFGLSIGARPSESKSISPTTPVSVVQPLPIRDRHVARRMLEPSQASFADSLDDPQDLSIDVSVGDEQIVMKRKHRRTHGGTLIVIQIIGVLVGRTVGDGGPRTVELEAAVTGADAVRGSLLFGLAWIAGDPDPLRAVRALGYDLEVSTEHERRCTDEATSEGCVEGARRLATLLDATLMLGPPGELGLFRQGALALGIAPDCVAAPTNGAPSVPQSASPNDPADLSIGVSIGDREIALTRKTGRPQLEFMEIKLSEVIVTSGPQGTPGGHGASIDLEARITGENIIPGSLLYAVAWLAGEPDPLESVRMLGYDIDVSIRHAHGCRSQSQAFTCENEAHGLATLLDATLALGDADERVQFRRDATAIGLAPQCSTR
jgi:hypothetical protein